MGTQTRPEYQVVLIDDEPVILRGLEAAVKWQTYGCRIAGTARDGRKGLELIRAKKPDIVFTDICMPDMDGLTMIAALKSEFPDMCIAILTGYRDFEYARTALTLGVERFLLKPSKMDELSEAIRFMTAKLEDRDKLLSDKLLSVSEGRPEVCLRSGEAGIMLHPANIAPADPHQNAPAVTRLQDSAAAGTQEQDAGMTPAGGFLVRAALKYMEEHCCEHILLSDVADQIYVSQWHLSKLLNRETGRKYSDLLNGFRIEKAKEYLSDPSMTIADIAEKVGFADLTNFSRVFRRQTGMSAHEYRNRIK